MNHFQYDSFLFPFLFVQWEHEKNKALKKSFVVSQSQSQPSPPKSRDHVNPNPLPPPPGLRNQRESANQIRAWIRVTANNENPNGFALKKLLNVKT